LHTATKQHKTPQRAEAAYPIKYSDCFQEKPPKTAKKHLQG